MATRYPLVLNGTTIQETQAGDGIQLPTALAIAYGGTGQTTANAAFNALAPSQVGNTGKYLTTDGTDTSWAANPLGTVTSVDVLGGTTGLTTSGGPITTSGSITIAGTLNVANGGTGVTSLAANNVILGNGTGAVQVVAPSTAGNVLTSNGTTWQSTTPPAAFSTSANNTFTGTQTFNGTSSNLATVLLNAGETVYIGGTNSGGGATAYFGNGSVQYYTSNNTTNWTQNLAFDVGPNLNTVMAIGQSLTMAILSTNGATAYYPTSIQINGSTSGVTTKWQGGTAPTAGNASSIDVYTYTIIKTASATFTVLASQTKFA